MPWTSQIEEACDKLTNDQEADGDWILVTNARICRIIVQAAEVARKASDDPLLAKHVVTHIGPLSMALETLKRTFTFEQLHHSRLFVDPNCSFAY